MSKNDTLPRHWRHSPTVIEITLNDFMVLFPLRFVLRSPDAKNVTNEADYGQKMTKRRKKRVVLNIYSVSFGVRI